MTMLLLIACYFVFVGNRLDAYKNEDLREISVVVGSCRFETSDRGIMSLWASLVDVAIETTPDYTGQWFSGRIDFVYEDSKVFESVFMVNAEKKQFILGFDQIESDFIYKKVEIDENYYTYIDRFARLALPAYSRSISANMSN